MFLRKSGIGAAAAALLAFSGRAALAVPQAYEMSFQPAASPVMEQIEQFHTELVWIIVAVCLFVLALLVWIVIKYRAGANPVPSKVHHNTLLEVAWTLIPVIILVFIAVPSFRLLYYEAAIPKPDVTIKAIGKQWFWSYEYPGSAAGFTYDSVGLSDADAKKADKPRLLGVDNPIYVPVNKVVEGRPHIVDRMLSGGVQLVFNTTEGAQAKTDSFSLRRTALVVGIPYYTTVAGSRAAVQAIGALAGGSLEVASLQSYFEASTATTG